MKFRNQLSILESATLMLALVFTCCSGCGKKSSSEPQTTHTTSPAAPSASTPATNRPTVKQDTNVRAVETLETKVAYDLPGGGIIYGPPGGMKILNPEWPTGKPGESIAGSFGVNQQGELIMSVGFPPRVISQYIQLERHTPP
jgi:hypothetical protein